MSNYLSNIVARNNNQLETVQPRLPSLYESSMLTRDSIITTEFDREIDINYLSEENIQESPRLSRNSIPEIHHSEEYPPWQQIPYSPQSPSPEKETHMEREPQRQTEYIFTRHKDESSTNLEDLGFAYQPQVFSQVNPTVENQQSLVINNTSNYFQAVESHNLKLTEPTVIQQLITKETFTKNTALTPEIQPLSQQPATQLVEQVILPMRETAPNNTEKSLIQEKISQTLITPKVSVVKELQPISNKSETAPTIQVTIGRIEVRATTPTTVSPSTKPKEKPAVMSLEEYLSQRGGGK
ncbi:hypothetical protein DSM106972_059380 [Dulcicalothrix desertica PCC 7102]|uniref:Uncharacterized protein n=1 Tax=Dulcicalothrix desertica PCC 7102 TaxID=232991 RepID=A0A3S1CGY6_9CYAN|nr:hypothetical protein [Dulcicalothrix desertica]RUT02460.1 hypothetical protein DSM106972_059380 [Dulcicalothrix desertica PCC 7102]TWH55322.1 hypothetical protein CAL7102_03446 [Dulcicalothrix desertica PCC 7102]